MKINCIITDDEPIAQEIIEDYLRMIPELELCAKCSNAVETIQALNSQHIDLLFLDIHLPSISGINLLKSLKNPPLVIFTTAYPEYALEGFNLDVVDYLLKPISVERFLKAIVKVYDQLPSGKKDFQSPISFEKDYLFIKTEKQYIKLFFKDILYLESAKDYVKIITAEKSLLTHSTMKQMELHLPSQLFFRVHHSFMVNEQKIDALEGNLLHIKKHRIPISRKYKPLVLNRLIH